MSNDTDRVREFVVGLHDYLVSWVNGKVEEDADAFEKSVKNRFDPAAMVVLPGGKALEAKDFLGFMRGGHGKNPDFRVKFTDFDVRHRVGDVVVSTCIEWQKNAMESRKQNGRRATMVLKDTGDDFRVLHVHETWLPEEEMEAGDYSF